MAGIAPTLVARSRTTSGPPNPLKTLDRMVKMTMQEFQSPELVELAVGIVARVQEKNRAAMAGALLQWIRRRTRFVADPVGQQLLKSPRYMLQVIARDGIAGGDCVDVAMLAAAMGMAVGLTAQFISEGYQPQMHAELVHVYAVLQTQYGWLNCDTQRGPDVLGAAPVVRMRTTIP